MAVDNEEFSLRHGLKNLSQYLGEAATTFKRFADEAQEIDDDTIHQNLRMLYINLPRYTFDLMRDLGQYKAHIGSCNQLSEQEPESTI